MKHTPLLRTPLTHGGNVIIDAEGTAVANMTNEALGLGESNGLQNAHIALIVKAVNCHVDLLEALEDELEYLLDEKQGDEMVRLQLDVRIKKFKAAIKLAKPTTS